MDELTFSLAEPGDADEIFRMYKSQIGTPGCTWNDEYPVIQNVYDDIQNKSLYKMTDSSGKIVAAASAGDCDEISDLDWSRSDLADLSRVCVLLSMKGRGVAGKMINSVIPAVKARGYTGIRLIASRTNPPALALYERCGFIRCGEGNRFGFDFYSYELIFK